MSPSVNTLSDGGGFVPSFFSHEKVKLLCGPDRDDRLSSRYIYLSYMDSSIVSTDQFEDGLRCVFQRMQYTDVRYYGCREQDAHGQVNYHILVNTGRCDFLPVSQAREAFRVDGNECASLDFFVRSQFSSVKQSVLNHVRFCQKQIDRFGQLDLISSDKLSR